MQGTFQTRKGRKPGVDGAECRPSHKRTPPDNFLQEVMSNISIDEDIEEEADDLASRYLGVHASGHLVGLPIRSVVSIVKLPKVTRLPLMPSHIKGVVNIRGTVYPVVGLREKTGMLSYEAEKEELIKMLKQREQDHRNWINELEASVREQRPFKLATDPHKCKFGLWYDKFKSEDFDVIGLLSRFDEPHKKIHAVAVQVEAHQKTKDFESAYQLINRTKSTILQMLIDLFNEMYVVIGNLDNQTLVLIDDAEPYGLAVDRPDEIYTIPPEDIEEVVNMNGVRQRMGKSKGKLLVLMNLSGSEATLAK